MKKTLVYLLAGLVVGIVSAQVYAEIEWSGNIMAGLEKMNYGRATTPDDYVSDKLQFSNIDLNLDVKADVCEGVTGVAELRTLFFIPVTRCIYVEMTNLIPNASIQVGRIELPLGAELSTKLSDGANTMRNPLIFNSLLTEDMEEQAVDDGLLIAGGNNAVNWKVGITNGVEGGDTNNDKAITLNLSGNVPPVPGLTLGGTYYTNEAAYELTETDNNEETTYKVKITDKVSKWIVDVGFQTGLLKLAAAIGNEETKTKRDTSSVTTVNTDYLVGEVVYGNGTTPWWVAARYSTKKPTTKPGQDPKDDVDKLELGVGYKLCDSTYLKAEYVNVKVDDKMDDVNDYNGIKAIVNVAF